MTSSARIAVLNQKGGVGKTTTSVNVAVALALRGHSTLVVDLDPSANCSQFLGVQLRDGWGSGNFLLGSDRFDPVTCHGLSSLDLVPATEGLALVERQLLGDLISGPKRLKKALAQVSDRYEFILTDCGPSLGMMAINAVVACPDVLIPIELAHAAAMGAITMQRFLDGIRVDIEPDVRLAGVLATFHDERESTPREVLQLLRTIFGQTVFETVIHASAAIRDAAGRGRPVVLDQPKSRGAQEYQSLTTEVINRVHVA